jgi:hypothetical protein
MTRYQKRLVLSLVVLICLYAFSGLRTLATPIECGPDVNLDGVVDLFDLVRVAIRYGEEMPARLPPWEPEDTNGDTHFNSYAPDCDAHIDKHADAHNHAHRFTNANRDTHAHTYAHARSRLCRNGMGCKRLGEGW